MTTVKQDLSHVSFHEAILTGIMRTGSNVTLTLEDVHVADVQRAAEVVVEGVDLVLRNDLPIADLRMEKVDGEVLTLREDGGRVLLAVEWNDFATRSQETVVYAFEGSEVTLQATFPA